MAMIATLIIGLLVSAVGLVMVAMAASRRRIVWRLTTALPVVYPFYVPLNWSNARVRNGFLVSVSGVLVIFGAIYGGVARELPLIEAREIGPRLPTALPPADPLPNAAAANAIVLPENHEFDPLADERFIIPAAPLAPRSDRAFKSVGSPHEYAYYALGPEHVHRHVGKVLKIVTRDGSIEEGVLTDSSASSLLLETVLPGGSAAFEYMYRDVAAIYLFDHEPPAAARTGNADVGTVNLPASWVASQVEPESPQAESSSPTNEPSNLESVLPDALSDLPVWAVPAVEGELQPVQERDFDSWSAPPGVNGDPDAYAEPL